jgi:sec-independent protein translocase protein TatC
MTGVTPDMLDEPVEEMAILDHLNDFRRRITKAAIALIVCTVASFAFANYTMEFLLKPCQCRVTTLSPTENLETFFKVSFITGSILAMPFVLYQLWKFVEPGLLSTEKKYAYIFVPSATILFLLGLSFGWFVLLPTALVFLQNFMSDIFIADWTSQEYIGFITSLLFWLGVSFQMPIVVYFFARSGLVTAELLRSQWRIAIVGISVIAAIITPTVDPVTMLLTMAPLSILYVMSIGLAKVGHNQFEKSMEIED